MESAKHTSTARRTHLEERPAPDGTRKGNFGDERGTNQSGAGVERTRAIVGKRKARTNAANGKPKGTRWGNGTPNANAAAPKSNGNSAPKLGRASHSLLGADRGRIEPLLRANANPKRRRAAPFGATTLKGRIRGLSSHEPPKGAARRGLGLFSLSLGNRENPPEENGTNRPPRNPTQTRGLLSHFATASSTASHCVGRVAAGVGGERGLFTRFSNRHQVSVRRQPRGSFGSYAPRCKQSYQHRAVSGPLWVGPPTARR